MWTGMAKRPRRCNQNRIESELKQMSMGGCGERKRERGQQRDRLLSMKNKLMVTKGGVGGRMGETVDGDEGGHL